MPLSLFNMAVSLAVLNSNRNVSSNTALADSVVAGLLPNGLGLAFPLIVNAQQPAAQQQNGSAPQNLALVPNVVGQDPTTAGMTLQQVQLTSTTQTVAVSDPTIKPNTVVQQDPQYNEIVPVGSNVSLFASPASQASATLSSSVTHAISGPTFGAPVVATPDVQHFAQLPQKLKEVVAEANVRSEAMALKLEGNLAEAVGKKISESEHKVLQETERMLGRHEEKLSTALTMKVTENEPKLLEKIEHLLDRKLPKKP